MVQRTAILTMADQ